MIRTRSKMKLSHKLTMGIILLSLAGIIVLVVVLSTFIRGMIVQQVRDNFADNNLIMAYQVDEWLHQFTHLLDGMALSVSEVQRPQMFGIARSFWESNPDISLTHIGFPDGYAIQNHGNPPAPGWYSYERAWYIVAMQNKSGQAVLTPNPEWSFTMQAWSIFAGRYMPVIDGAEYGAVGFTIDIASAMRMMNDFNIPGGGYAFLISYNGNFISHPDPQFAPTDVITNMSSVSEYAGLLNRIIAGENFIPVTGTNGVSSYVLHNNLGGADWIMVSVIPVSAINSSINTVVTSILATVLAILIALTVFVVIMVSRLVHRGIGNAVLDFRESSSALARGEGLKISNERDDSFGLDELRQELEANLTIFANLVEDIPRMSTEHLTNGDYTFRIDENKYEGVYRRIINVLNDLVITYGTDMVELINVAKSYGEGDFTANVSQYPDSWKWANDSVDNLRANFINITTEIETLTKSAAHGDLDVRADASKFKGDWTNVIMSLNSLVDAAGKPVAEIRKVAARFNEGYLDRLMTGDYSGDFLAIKNDMNAIIKGMGRYVLEIDDCLNALADGDLTRRSTMVFLGEFDKIGKSINNISERLHKTMSEIFSASEQVLTGAKQITTSAMDLANGAVEQASSIEELNASVDMINQQTEQNANSAEEASALSNKSTENAQLGNEAVKQMLEAMSQIKASSSDISRIINTIQNIAFQTNLLALNASVEAARAGEHGRGFSVVAEEVRNLAVRSQEAATETTGLIDTSINRVDAGSSIAESTEEVLGSIVSSAEEVLQVIDAIALSSRDQAEAIQQVVTGLSQISSVVQSNSAVSEETAASAEELNSQAELLRQLVSYFKL